MPRELRRPLAGHDGELELPPGWAKVLPQLPIRYSGSALELCAAMLTTTLMKALWGLGSS